MMSQYPTALSVPEALVNAAGAGPVHVFGGNNYKAR